MGRVFSLTITAVALAVVWVTASASTGYTTVADLKALGKAAGLTGATYRLSSIDGGSCLVAKSAKPIRGAATVKLDTDCDNLAPGLSRVRFWRERADGAIEFTGEAGEALAAFAVVEGSDYESVRPRSPVLRLTRDRG